MADTINRANIDNLKYLQRLFVKQRTPASGSINLTHRCNLNCVHCYLGGHTSNLRSAKTELSTQQWLSIIDQITDAGCLDLLFSGGEVMLRSDFELIYKKAVTKGLLVTVFTNGTLINEKILSLFADLPPQYVEISLYGATTQTYESITGIKGSFDQCLRGIQKLFDRNIRFKLKTMMLTQNCQEWDEIKNIADSFGVKFRMDPVVFACLDGNKSPLDCRVDPAEAVKADFSDPDRARLWKEYFLKTRKPSSGKKLLFNCGAGLTNFHIDPAGILSPCLMLKKPAYDLVNGNFKNGWENEIYKLRRVNVQNDFKCNDCNKREICGSCPAFFELENGSPEMHSQYFCDLGEYRLKEITSSLPIEKNLL